MDEALQFLLLGVTLGAVLVALRKLDDFANRMDAVAHTAQAERGAIMATVSEIVAKVADVRGKTQSLITLCGEIAQAIRDNAGNQAALDQLATDLDSQAGEVQAALDANADVDPTP